ncbi:sugar ABC transporter substrate-binding protein [Bacillus canaveralius]|uniref:Sugar ABC transporter substrate-binding protein n=1 Tax=Bacillus canaveralius TaxID=1403243 RepID=A0A2N5GSG9_9BACI|nr:substrate-binding domain-containing protein [Bacillus canaveralius]PLR86719.1 sugar ABC transporter substrate-binding protein [Bacillus canaveralius]PLR92819.1 sugar ABC transporter substrate-binding protein [Bacillus canaveralius]RSK54689.1 sugar ABC transporter substrate-binding protein [Bacillus canaveralius]
MKKRMIVFVVLMMATLALVLAGCSGDKTSATDKEDGSKGKKTVGWAMAYFDHPVYQTMMKASKEVAEKEGIELVFADGKNDPVVQASLIDNFIAQKVDAIIVTPTVADPLIPAIKKINEAGIPLLIVDRTMNTRGTGIKWDALVSWDMAKSGTLGAQQVAESINKKGKVVVVEGTPGAGPTIERGNAFYEELKKYPEVEVVYKVSADFNRTKGMEVTENILQRYSKGEIDAIYYMNDEMALGGIQAIKSAGRLHDFKVISVDGQKEAMDAVRAGEIDEETIFRPDEEAVAVSIAASIARGEKPDLANQSYNDQKFELTEFEGMPWVRPTCYKVDKSNLDAPEWQGW